jgi:TPR repeat protein
MGEIMRLNIYTILFFLVTLASSTAWADLHAEALKAYDDADFAKAHTIWIVEAKQGKAYAQSNLGLLYWEGKGVSKNYKEAVEWFLLAANQGYAEAQNKLGHAYEIGLGAPKDIKEAVKWYNLAASQGHAKSQFDLGLLYEAGKVVGLDCAESVRWYRLAANQGHKGAQYRLGVIYIEGKGGVPQDYTKAAKWFRLAAEQGNMGGQFYLGWLYDKGKGVSQDYKEAAKWYRLASTSGESSAQLNLGWLHVYGRGVPQDDQEALRLFRESIGVINLEGWCGLGFMYEHGRGVEKDLKEALDSYNRCGFPWAVEPYERLIKKLDCLKSAKTQLFGINLFCAKREDMMSAAKKIGAKVKIEDKSKWGDTYFTTDILSGSSELYIGYTYDDKFAVAEYTFPSSMDVNQVTKIKEMVLGKYGQPTYSSGAPTLGEVTYRWVLEDDIELKVWRGWPKTTTYLTYTHPENYQAMKAKQEEQRREKEQVRYQEQSNAF